MQGKDMNLQVRLPAALAQTIKGVAMAQHEGNMSQATRFIIRDWRRLKDQYEPAPNCSQNVRESGTLEAAQ